MKSYFSLAFLTIGAVSLTLLVNVLKKSRTDGRIVMEAATIVEKVSDQPKERDTVWVTAYKVKYKFIPAPRQEPEVFFTDTSKLSLPENMEDLGVRCTIFKDSIQKIQMVEYIHVPKTFILQDTNVYLAATVLATGIVLDSLSFDPKL